MGTLFYLVHHHGHNVHRGTQGMGFKMSRIKIKSKVKVLHDTGTLVVIRLCRMFVRTTGPVSIGTFSSVDLCRRFLPWGSA